MFYDIQIFLRWYSFIGITVICKMKIGDCLSNNFKFPFLSHLYLTCLYWINTISLTCKVYYVKDMKDSISLMVVDVTFRSSCCLNNNDVVLTVTFFLLPHFNLVYSDVILQSVVHYNCTLSVSIRVLLLQCLNFIHSI